MTRKISQAITLASVIFLFSGCAQREIMVPQPEIKQSQENDWAKETNIEEEENIDISDINDDSIEYGQEESEQIVTETPEPRVEKMERIAFPAEEYRRLARRGKGTINGFIYLQNPYGKRVLGAGTRLYLNPVTSYSKQWYNESYLNGYKLKKADARLFNHLKFTAAGGDGSFSFYNVPKGSYYLIGTVRCADECGFNAPKNVRIATRVEISGKQTIEKDLTKLID